MMDPPVTNSPPNTLMPSRCAFESRPFLELPKPFLCAIYRTYLGVCPVCGRIYPATTSGRVRPYHFTVAAVAFGRVRPFHFGHSADAVAGYPTTATGPLR